MGRVSMAVQVGRESAVRPQVEQRSKSVPVTGWAIFGAAWLVFYAYVYIAWFAGPDLKRVAQGPSQLPGWMDTLFAVYIPFGIVATAGAIYWWIIRPRMREKRFSTAGLLLIVFIIFWVQDPFINYFQPTFTYNSAIPNL